jgi:glycosyltransferase involved in cell wall biosynthesis
MLPTQLLSYWKNSADEFYSMKNKKLLILTTSLSAKKTGGVSNYYSALDSKFSFQHDYCVVGDREDDGILSNVFIRLITDYLLFIKSLITNSYDLVVINPSLTLNGLIRDYVFFLIAKSLGNKTVIFFRGWERKYEEIVFRTKWRYLFLPVLKCDGFIVLAKSFREAMLPSVKSPVFIETTVLDEEILEGYDETNIQRAPSPNRKLRLLYLARIEKYKGVFTAIEAFKKLKEQSIEVELLIAGNGSELDKVKVSIEGVNDPNLRYIGLVDGEEKKQLLLNSDILLFPSTHSEGMPNTVLEAMGCGLAVITTKMGGVDDFFCGDTMGGELVDDFPTEIAQTVKRLINNPAELSKISLSNYTFAKRYFYSSKVATRLDGIFNAVLYQTDCKEFWIDKPL